MSEAAVSAHDLPTRFWRDRTGAVAIAVAVLLPVLIGFAGIGIEVGLWFAIQRQNQSATDAAAISAALEYAAQIEQTGITTNPTAAAATAANYNLFSTSSPNTLTVSPCYNFSVGGSCNTSNPNGTTPNAVQVVLTQPLNKTFANVVTSVWGPSTNTVNVTTTSIAEFPMLPGGQTCLLAVGSGQTSSVSAGATLNLPKCTLASLSILGNSIQLPGSTNPVINAAAIATAGNVQVTGGSGGTPPPQTFTYLPLQDPYKSVTIVKPTGHCIPDPKWSSNTLLPLTQGFYCGLTFSGAANVQLNPGVYYIDGVGSGGGNFTIAGAASVTGTGVTIVLTNVTQAGAGGIEISVCGATISLSAPGTGQGLLPPSATASQGLLFFQDPTTVNSFTSASNVIANNCGTSNVTLNGAIYTPASLDNLQGNASASFGGCTELIAQSFTFSGNLGFDDTGCSAVGIVLNQAQIQQVYLAM